MDTVLFVTGLIFMEKYLTQFFMIGKGLYSIFCHQLMSEFAFFQSENKAISRSILILLLYNAYGTVDKV